MKSVETVSLKFIHIAYVNQQSNKNDKEGQDREQQRKLGLLAPGDPSQVKGWSVV